MAPSWKLARAKTQKQLLKQPRKPFAREMMAQSLTGGEVQGDRVAELAHFLDRGRKYPVFLPITTVTELARIHSTSCQSCHEAMWTR